MSGNTGMGVLGYEPKGDIFLSRYVRLAHAVHENTPDGDGLTVADLAGLWDCSERAAQESLQRLAAWGLLRWNPQSGRGKRSAVALLVHPVHVYYERAERALTQGGLAEAGFWLGEIMRECPCIPAAAALLTHVRQQLGLTEVERCCPGQLVEGP